MKWVIALLIIIAGMNLLFWIEGVEVKSEPEPISHLPTIDYLMKANEVARDTHQFYADNPEMCNSYSGSVGNNEQWVRIYNMNLEILESLK